MSKILFLDDNPARHALMESRFPGDVIHVYDIDSFRGILEEHESFDMVSLDYDLNEFDAQSLFLGEIATGLDACGYMVKYRDKLPAVIEIHSINPTGARKMVDFLENKGFVCRWKMFDDVQFDDQCFGNG